MTTNAMEQSKFINVLFIGRGQETLLKVLNNCAYQTLPAPQPQRHGTRQTQQETHDCGLQSSSGSSSSRSIESISSNSTGGSITGRKRRERHSVNGNQNVKGFETSKMPSRTSILEKFMPVDKPLRAEFPTLSVSTSRYQTGIQKIYNRPLGSSPEASRRCLGCSPESSRTRLQRNGSPRYSPRTPQYSSASVE